VRSREARSVVATVAARVAPRPSVGLACAALSPSGELIGGGDPALLAELHALEVETGLVVANPGSTGFDGVLAARVLHDPATRAKLVESLLAARAREGDAAIEVDLEAMPTSARADLVALVAALRAGAPEGVRIEVDVHPKTTDDPGWTAPARTITERSRAPARSCAR